MKTQTAGRLIRQEGRCLECGGEMQMDERLLVGEVLECGACGTTLEVVQLEPLELAPLAKVEEEAEDFADWSPSLAE